MKKPLLATLLLLVLFGISLMQIDRYFFKNNKSFCIQTILSTLPPQATWETPAPTPEENKILNETLMQKFHYLARGGQSSVFLSEDKKYVLKFYRFPSHLRPMGWLKHPLAYRFSSKRKQIEAHNFEKLNITFQSFKLAYEELKDESGLIYLHLNPSLSQNLSVTLVDHLGKEYFINLDQVTFLMQKRADGIFSTLESLLHQGAIDQTKRVLDSIVYLIEARCAKGITDNDALLEQNYGICTGKAIHVDIGRLAYDPKIVSKEETKKHVHKVVWKLRQWLKEKSPELSDYFEQHLNL
jgi:hypothetical protein